MFHASVSAIITNSKKQILLVSKDGVNEWKTVTGWVENETIDNAIRREVKEELNIEDVKIIDVVDTHTFNYNGEMIISIFFLMKYDHGEIITNDDIKNYEYKWFNEKDINTIKIICPRQIEIMKKAFFYINKYYKDKYGKLAFYKYKWNYD